MNTAADLQRWSDDVARDPRSLAFLPLARAYRRQGLVDAALQLCLRGLEHYPSNIEAHSLLALLYLEQGDHEKAADEWSMVLRMDRDNFEALRGMGFCYLERDQLAKARQMLERASLLRPGDATVREALALLGARHESADGRADTLRRDDPLLRDDPWAEAARGAEPDAGTAARDATAATPGETAQPAAGPDATEQPDAAGEVGEVGDRELAAVTGVQAAAGATPSGSIFELVDEPGDGEAGAAPAGTTAMGEPQGVAAVRPRAGGTRASTFADPTRLFDELLEGGTLLGALLVDAHGLVHAGRLNAEVSADPALIGAVLGGSVEEAARAVHHLAMGEWRGILLEAGHALLQLTPVGTGAVVILAARRSVPAGWLMRAGGQAAERAARYLEADA
jgi:tetratricopeptide (TPR) repeat protein